MSVQFPAFRPYCGLVFESSLISIRGSVSGLVLEENREQCPRCGQWAELPDGTFDVVGDTVHILAASDLTRERLLRLQAIIDAATAGEMSDEDATKAIAEEVPELGSLIARLRPKMGRALVVFLFALLQIFVGQALSEYRDHAASRDDLERVVEQAIEQCKSQTPPIPRGGHYGAQDDSSK